MIEITAQNMRDPEVWPLMLKAERGCIGISKEDGKDYKIKGILCEIDLVAIIFTVFANHDIWLCHAIFIPETKHYYMELDELWREAKRRFPNIWINSNGNWIDHTDTIIKARYQNRCGMEVTEEDVAFKRLPDWAIIEKEEELIDGTQTENM